VSRYAPHALRTLARRARAVARAAAATGDQACATHWGRIAESASQRLSAAQCQASKSCPHRRGACPVHAADWWGAR
jgi:hypothetical protein